MERKGFLKSLITLMAAPTLIGGINSNKKISDIPKDELKSGKLQFDTLRIYFDNIDEFMLRDIVISDLGSKAMITHICNFKPKYIEVRPLKMNEYNFKNPKILFHFGRQFAS